MLPVSPSSIAENDGKFGDGSDGDGMGSVRVY